MNTKIFECETGLIERYRRSGGALRFVFCSALDSTTIEAHRSAARVGIEEVRRQIDEYFDRLIRSCGDRREKYFSVVIPPDFPATSERVTWEEFLPLFRYAVLEPPYGLRLAEAEAEKLFSEMCESLFPSGEDSVIVQHETKRCNFFDAGREWWGEFFWTVGGLNRGVVVAILGSTTD